MFFLAPATTTTRRLKKNPVHGNSGGGQQDQTHDNFLHNPSLKVFRLANFDEF
jgi:hypothetical protein